MINAGRHTGSDIAEEARAGRYLTQPAGYRAFIPAPLPPSPPLRIAGDLQRLLSDADRALGRLDGSVQTLPNPDLFVYMYVRKEAVLSSQIEGTQSLSRTSSRPKPTSWAKAGRVTSMKWSTT
jgi:hypothetical protein